MAHGLTFRCDHPRSHMRLRGACPAGAEGCVAWAPAAMRMVRLRLPLAEQAAADASGLAQLAGLPQRSGQDGRNTEGISACTACIDGRPLRATEQQLATGAPATANIAGGPDRSQWLSRLVHPVPSKGSGPPPKLDPRLTREVSRPADASGSSPEASVGGSPLQRGKKRGSTAQGRLVGWEIGSRGPLATASSAFGSGAMQCGVACGKGTTLGGRGGWGWPG